MSSIVAYAGDIFVQDWPKTPNVVVVVLQLSSALFESIKSWSSSAVVCQARKQVDFVDFSEGKKSIPYRNSIIFWFENVSDS